MMMVMMMIMTITMIIIIIIIISKYVTSHFAVTKRFNFSVFLW